MAVEEEGVLRPGAGLQQGHHVLDILVAAQQFSRLQCQHYTLPVSQPVHKLQVEAASRLLCGQKCVIVFN